MQFTPWDNTFVVTRMVKIGNIKVASTQDDVILQSESLGPTGYSLAPKDVSGINRKVRPFKAVNIFVRGNKYATSVRILVTPGHLQVMGKLVDVVIQPRFISNQDARVVGFNKRSQNYSLASSVAETIA